MLTIPAEAVATWAPQAGVDATDYDAISAGLSGVGVASGCAVTPQSTPNMTVQVAAGTVVVGGVTVTVNTVASLTIGAASAHDRKDIVVVNNAGTVSVVAGTAATGTVAGVTPGGTRDPAKAAIPANSVLLAEVYVATTTTTIVAGNIIDKRPFITSVAGRTGAVALTAADIGAGTFPANLDVASSNYMRFHTASDYGQIMGVAGNTLDIQGASAGFRIVNHAYSVANMTILDSGFVGLGMSPTTLLDANGTIRNKGLLVIPNQEVSTSRRSLDVYNARAIIGGTTTPATPTGMAGPTLTVQPNTTTDASALLIKGVAGQVGDLLELQDPNGAVILSANQAPADLLQLTDTSGGISRFTQRGSLLATGGLQAMGTVVQQGNLFTPNQASLETDTTGWFVGVNSTLTRSTAQALSGAASLAVTAVASGDMSAGCWTGAGKTTPGQVYTVVASARAAATPRPISVRIDWNLAGTYVTSSQITLGADSTTSFQQVSQNVMAPPGTDGATLIFTIYGCAAAEVHYIDCAAIYPNPTANLLDDSDFDNTYGLENWAVGGGSIAISTDVAWTGIQSMKITTVGTGTTTANSGFVLLGAGVTVTFSVRVWLATAYGLGNVYMDMTGAGSLDSANFNADLSKTNQWQYITGTVTTTTSGAHYVRLVSGDNGHPIAGTIYLDAVKLEVGATATPYVPPMYSNLIVNPSFELDATGWSPVSTQTLSTTPAWSAVGGKSLVVTSGGTTIDCYAAQTVYTTAPTVTFSATAYLPNPLSGSLDSRSRAIQCYTFNAAGSLVSGYNSNALPNTAKATGRLSVTVPVPAGGRVEVRLYNGSITPGDTVYWDAVQCDLGNVANPYIDGSMGPGYSWDASNNLLSAQNASLESAGVGSWLAGPNWTIANSTATALDGTHSLRATRSNTTAGNGYAYINVPVAALTTYTASMWVRASAATAFLARVDYQDASHTGLSSSANTTFTGVVGSYIRVAFTFTTPANTAYVNYLIADDGNATPTTGSWLDIDAIQLEQRTYATPYGSVVATASNATSTYQAPWYVGSSGAGARIEVGRSDGVASVPRLDFHAIGLAEFDVRLQASALGSGPGQGQLDLFGKLVVNTPPFTNATGLEIVANSVLTGRGPELQLYDTNPAYGSTGSKFMRVNSGALQFVNSGYGAVIWTLDDSGQTHAVDTLHMAHATHGLISVAYAGVGEDNDSYGIVGVTAPAGANRAYYSMTAAGNSVYGMGMGTDNLLRLGAISTGKVMGANVVKIDGSGNLTAAGTVNDSSGRVYSPGNPPPGPTNGVTGQSDSLIIKSGAVSTSSSSFNFATAFPTACTAVVMTGPQAGTIPIIVNVTSYGTTGFSYVARTNSNTTPGTLTLNYVAIGY